jgi:hypothetical protein
MGQKWDIFTVDNLKAFYIVACVFQSSALERRWAVNTPKSGRFLLKNE